MDAGGLSDAERHVLEMALRGLSNREIARTRGVSVRTVCNQMASGYEKLGVSSRLQLAARWSRIIGPR
jgi:DNA-binding CsgD family transcriptional regulator